MSPERGGEGRCPRVGVRLAGDMLYADKRALETNLKVSLLAIREKELNYYSQNCLAVGTQAALLAGFAYSGLTQVPVAASWACSLRLLPPFRPSPPAPSTYAHSALFPATC